MSVCRRLFTSIAVLCLISQSMLVAAALLPDLYDVELAVASKAKAELDRASREGLQQVLLRVSGSTAVLDDEGVKQALRRPQPYLKQFSYRHDDEGAVLLSLEFEGQMLADLLRRQGLPFWSAQRPTVLLWLVADDGQGSAGQGRAFVGAGNYPQLQRALQQQARRRGLILRFPSLDLEDNIALSPDELWGLNSHKIELAAGRYDSDSLLLGSASRLTSGQWLGQWRYSLGAEQWQIDASAGFEMRDYAARVIDMVAEKQAARFAIVPQQMAEGLLLMRLTGIDDFNDYSDALGYLQSLAAVRAANPVSVIGDEMIVQLRADGQLSQLQEVLARGGKLRLEQPPAPEPAEAAQSPVGDGEEILLEQSESIVETDIDTAAEAVAEDSAPSPLLARTDILLFYSWPQ